MTSQRDVAVSRAVKLSKSSTVMGDRIQFEMTGTKDVQEILNLFLQDDDCTILIEEQGSEISLEVDGIVGLSIVVLVRFQAGPIYYDNTTAALKYLNTSWTNSGLDLRVIENNGKLNEILDVFPCLEEIILLSRYISKVNSYEHKGEDGCVSYIIVSHEEEGAKTIAVTPDFTTLQYDNIKRFDKLLKKLDFVERNEVDRVEILKSTMMEMCSHIPDSNIFDFLVNNFVDVFSLYNRNYSVFVNRFKFHKIKAEISSNIIDYIGKASVLSSDLMSKALAMPISIAGAAAIVSFDNIMAGMLVVISSLFLYYIFISSLEEKAEAIDQIENIAKFIFKDIKFLDDSLREDVSVEINSLYGQIDNIKSNIFVIRILAGVSMWLIFTTWLFKAELL